MEEKELDEFMSCARRPRLVIYQSPCIYSKGALLVLMSSLFMSSPLTLLQLMGLSSANLSYGVFVANSVIFLLFPFFGLIGEYWMRAKFMLAGSFFIVISSTSYTAVLMAMVFGHSESPSLIWCLLFISYIYFFGQTWLLSNVIQFGVDQLQFSPSQQLSNFVCWFYLIFYSYPAFCLAVFAIAAYYKFNYYAIVSVLTLKILINVTFLAVVLYLRKLLVLEPAQHNNPVKLIWQVTRYAKRQRQVVRPSAFTYGEGPPSKLDYAKERYGGPFTTEQVEDVKSFWRIIVLFLSTYGYAFRAFPICLADKLIGNVSDSSFSLGESTVLLYPFTVPFLTVSVCILAYQIIAVPFFSHCIPKTLKRMWIGLLAVLLQVIVLTVFNYMNRGATFNSDGSYYILLLVPQVLYGLSLVFFFVTIFEFALAQAPVNMRGLLIGFFYMYYGFSYLDIILSKSSIGCYWEYHAVKTLLVFISLVMYTYVAYKYEPRQRNEVSDINERIIITQYTERQLDRRDEYYKESNNQISVLVNS